MRTHSLGVCDLVTPESVSTARQSGRRSPTRSARVTLLVDGRHYKLHGELSLRGKRRLVLVSMSWKVVRRTRSCNRVHDAASWSCCLEVQRCVLLVGRDLTRSDSSISVDELGEAGVTLREWHADLCFILLLADLHR